MKHLLLAALAAAAFTGCTGEKPVPNAYTINGVVRNMDGQTVAMLNGRDTIATTTVSDSTFTFKGVADTTRMMVITIDRAHGAQLFVEPGTITVDLDSHQAKGSSLNDDFAAFTDFMADLRQKFTAEGANQDSLEALYDDCVATLSTRHAGDLLGLEFFRQQAYDLSKAALDSVMALYPLYQADPQLQKLAANKVAEERTSVGCPYVNVEGVNAATGKAMTLADVVAGGKPVIVDFWASWCGPCRHEIQEYLSKYAPRYKGKCNFVGIAVWENSIDDTKQAMAELPITWPVLFAGGRGEDSPTTYYGISGIPQILLIGTDGTILARGLRGEKIAEAIEDALKRK